MKKLLAVSIIFLFFVMIIFPSSGIQIENKTVISSNRGDTLYVGGNGTGNYSKIQDAIDDASDGDTVFVYNGTYYETVDIDKSINLIGDDRDITKIINEFEDYYAVDITADLVNISGFTIFTYGFKRFSNGLISISSCNNNVSNNILKGDWWNEYWHGIELSGSSNNNTIIGNIISTNMYGIYISSSNNNIIKNNNFSDYNWLSIGAFDSNNNIIMDNNFWKNEHDIILEDNCVNNTIINNAFSKVQCCLCINLRYSSNKNIVMNNTMISVPGGNGILIQYSKENIIIGNTIKDLKWQSGIYLWSATDNTITSNNLICCNKGISSYEEDASNDNTIHHNNFYNNTQNAYDQWSNEWDNGYPSGGNYWDDYSGEDNDGDGIGDTPYNISGGNNQDKYPLMEPWEDNLLPIAKFDWTPLHPDLEEEIVFNASDSIDYDGYISQYEWDWDNDGVYDESYSSPTINHTFEEIGYHLVTLLIQDNGAEIDTITKTIRVGNQPPETPIVDGPTHGKPGIDYNYTFVSTDPDGDDVWYHISWGDKEIIYIYGPYPSGEEITLSYNWSEKGTYIISCWARDIYYAISNVSTLEVTMPRDKATTYSLLQRWIERYPLLNRLLSLTRI